jgi:hypothetical protein
MSAVIGRIREGAWEDSRTGESAAQAAPAAIVRIAAVDESGAPVRGALVSVVELDRPGCGSLVRNTGEDGLATFAVSARARLHATAAWHGSSSGREVVLRGETYKHVTIGLPVTVSGAEDGPWGIDPLRVVAAAG